MKRRMAFIAIAGLAMLGCRDGQEVLPGDEIRAGLTALPGAGRLELASGDTIQVGTATLDFYRSRRWRPAWVNEKDLLEQGRLVHETIGRSWEDGLPPAGYRHDAAETLLARLEADGDEQLADSLEARYLASLDLVLTEGMSRYANDLVSGTLDPKAAGLDWRIPRGEAREATVLKAILAGQHPGQVVATLRPAIPNYERTRKALIAFHQIAGRGGWPVVPEGAYAPGERSPSVSVLRARLAAGLDDREADLARRGASDPTLFDDSLKAAVAHFQERHGIEADGRPGSGTLRELNHTIEQRIEELQINLDRWRWLPDNLPERYIMVNIAGFELELVDQNRIVQSMNVVVGQASWQTPVFVDTIEHIVVNPYWNVPASIYNEEIVPRLTSDPGWLERNNYERTRDGGVRQRPGPGNALGKYKFVFPNKDDIYLHDTPAGHLFSRSRRDFSHGCIRLEKPEELARTLVRMQTNQDAAILARLAATSSERWIKLDRPLPIYLLYFTAWVEEDGTVRFHHDVYGRDEQLSGQKGKLALR